MNIEIRRASLVERDSLWQIIEPVIRKGGSYVFAQDSSKEKIMDYWMGEDKWTFVAESSGEVVGTFYLKANQPDLGDHICNAGFIVSPQATGRGVGRFMGKMALEEACRLGFLAMQFNFVIKSNTSAVKLWQSLGFQIIGEIPDAYRHPNLGWVSALVMYQKLSS
ncbi:MAG: GNAT family N-acetyltransferase [Algoriphagus sp. 32-45-6]|jgi:ribosomal protein S18 acetylase RimI-like enzyme|nr:MAG: GNAT family N-acetyltransferase [Algoriphagus sp. 32-45-6]